MNRLYFLPLSFFLTFIFSVELKAQNAKLPDYPMKFQFRNSHGDLRDTSMFSRLKFTAWSKSSAYPAYVKWKNQPFAVNLSSINGVGLFTDSSSSFSTGQTIGYAFYKVGSSGRFDLDYLESNIGSFINNADEANMEAIKTDKGIVLKAKQNIASNTELTVSYQSIINLFPNDPSASQAIKYW